MNSAEFSQIRTVVLDALPKLLNGLATCETQLDALAQSLGVYHVWDYGWRRGTFDEMSRRVGDLVSVETRVAELEHDLRCECESRDHHVSELVGLEEERNALAAALRALVAALPRCEYVDKSGAGFKPCRSPAVVETPRPRGGRHCINSRRCRTCPTSFSARGGASVKLPWSEAVRAAEVALSALSGERRSEVDGS